MSEHLTAHERVAPMHDRPYGPLRGVKVIDLTTAIAGPWASMMLADLGADVIKVEEPGGESQRVSGPFTKDDELRAFGGAFGSYNRNKRAIALDLKNDEDRAIFLDLVASADMLIENMRAGILDRLGLGFEVLRERNARLVYGAIRGYGDPRTGESPHSNWPCYDLVAQAYGGVISMTGFGPDQRVRTGPFLGDIYTGTVLATAVLAALHHARETGQGQFVDVSMVDAMIAIAEQNTIRYTYFGDHDVPPTGNTHPHIVPFDMFDTVDGAVVIAAPGDHQWRRLAELIGQPELGTDERVARLNSRNRNREVVTNALAAWCGARTTAEVLAVVGGEVPIGPVNRIGDIVHDPHVVSREMMVSVDQPSGRPVILTNTPMRFTDTPAGIYRRPPMVDEHRAEILEELKRDSPS